MYPCLQPGLRTRYCHVTFHLEPAIVVAATAASERCRGNCKPLEREALYATLESNICDYLHDILLVQIPCLPGCYR